MLQVEELNDRLIDLAFSEDIGDGDHTTLCCIPADAMGESKLLIKEEGIFAGVDIAKRVFHRFDPELVVEVYIEDGAHVKPGDIVMSVKGREQSLLQTERLMLNILQRMSGIATMTHKYQQALIDAGTKTRVLDTRKTTPGMRMLEKEAVHIGGGTNHRSFRYDTVKGQPHRLLWWGSQRYFTCKSLLQGERQGLENRVRGAQLQRTRRGIGRRLRPYYVR